MKRVLLAVAGILLLTGCGTTMFMTTEQKRTMIDQWVGSDINEIITRLGMPTTVLDDRQGGKIYIWEKTLTSPGTATTQQGMGFGSVEQQYQGYGRSTGSVSIYPGQSSTTYTPPQVIKREQALFWVNPQGIIYKTGFTDVK